MNYNETVEKVIVQETENVSTDNTFSFSDWLKKVPSQSKDEKNRRELQNRRANRLHRRSFIVQIHPVL